MNKKALVLLTVGGIVLLSSRKASASGKTYFDAGGFSPPDTGGGGYGTDLCDGNARRTRNMDEADESRLVPVESHGSQEYMIDTAAAALGRMVSAARRAGFSAPLFETSSGYRSRASQTAIWNRQLAKQRDMHPGWSEAQIVSEARNWVAPPGASDHETGCATDLWLGYGISSSNNNAIWGSAAFQWLQNNAYRFGFCNYEKEGWHWKYVGEL